MTDKLVHISEDQAIELMKSRKLNYLKDFGNYNKMPEPYVEVDFDEFMRIFTTYSPIFVDFRQVHIPGDRFFRSYKLFFFGDCAYAISRMEDDKYNIKYLTYRLGCMHNYRGMSAQECHEAKISPPSMCWHVDKCDKCGMIRTTDSSD